MGRKKEIIFIPLGEVNPIPYIIKKFKLQENEINELTQVFNKMNLSKNGKLTINEIWKSMAADSILVKQKDVEEYVWEVDESGKGYLDLKDFFMMYVRAKKDSIGLEPKRLFNYVLYRMIDTDGDGSVQMDELMEYLGSQIPSKELVGNLERLLGNSLYTKAMSSLTSRQWLRTLQCSLWKESCPLRPVGALGEESDTIMIRKRDELIKKKKKMLNGDWRKQIKPSIDNSMPRLFAISLKSRKKIY